MYFDGSRVMGVNQQHDISQERATVERFWKAHGLGNDYLVWTDGLSSQSNELTVQRVVKICDRHRGLGSDGILEPKVSSRADIGLRIWNPDGSKAEKSGNGIRIFAWWWAVYQNRVVGAKPFTVDTGYDVVSCVVDRETGVVDVEMGRATFDKELIPTAEDVWARSIQMPDGTNIDAYAVGIGNPHCVIFVDNSSEFSRMPWREWGAYLEYHALFPNRINVQFATVLSESSIEIRIWERGAGETAASGTSSCAVACAAHRLGLVGDKIEMKMQGGVLNVEIEADWSVRLCGPVETVATMETDL